MVRPALGLHLAVLWKVDGAWVKRHGEQWLRANQAVQPNISQSMQQYGTQPVLLGPRAALA